MGDNPDDSDANLDALKAKHAYNQREIQERVEIEDELQLRLKTAKERLNFLADDHLDAQDRFSRAKYEHDCRKEEADVVTSRYAELMEEAQADQKGLFDMEEAEEEEPKEIRLTPEQQIAQHLEQVKEARRAEEADRLAQAEPGGGGEVVVEPKGFDLEFDPKIFRVTEKTTFAQLRSDVELFYNLPKGSTMLCTTKGLVWTGGCGVMDHIARLEEELMMYEDFDDEDLCVQAWKKPEVQSQEEEYVKPKRPPRQTKKGVDKDAEARALRQERLASSLRWELGFYLIYVVGIILISMYRIPLKPAFEMMDSIKACVEDDFPPELGHTQKNFLDAANSEEMYMWMKFPWLGGLAEDPWILGNNNMIVGGFRIRNLRVKPNATCTVTDKYNKFPPYECYAPYTTAARDEEPFGQPVVYNGQITKKFHFWESEYSMTGTMGKVADYDGDGYVWDCNRVWDQDTTLCLKQVQGLEDQGFVDDATRAVIVTATVYNRNFQLWAWVKLVFEFSPGGQAYSWGHYVPLKIDLYFTEEDTLRMVFEIICSVWTLVYTIRWVREIILAKRELGSCVEFFKDFWNWYELVMLVLAYATIALTLWYFLTVKEMSVSVEELYYVDMEAPAQGYALVGQIMSLFSFMAIIKLFKYMAISQKLGLIGRALGKGGPDLGTFMLVFIILYFAFVFMGYQIFGPQLYGYSTIFKSVTSLFLSSAGVVDYYDLQQAHPIFAPLFWILYVIVVIFVLLNMFIGIICEAFSEESAAMEVTLIDEIREAQAWITATWKRLMTNDQEARLLAELQEQM